MNFCLVWRLCQIWAKNDFTHFTSCNRSTRTNERISDDDAKSRYWWWCLDDVVVVVVVIVDDDDVVALTHSTPTPDACGGARLNIACTQWHTMLWNSSTSHALIQRHIRDLWGRKSYWRMRRGSVRKRADNPWRNWRQWRYNKLEKRVTKLNTYNFPYKWKINRNIYNNLYFVIKWLL